VGKLTYRYFVLKMSKMSFNNLPGQTNYRSCAVLTLKMNTPVPEDTIIQNLPNPLGSQRWVRLIKGVDGRGGVGKGGALPTDVHKVLLSP
jgi:hypothetical protein